MEKDPCIPGMALTNSPTKERAVLSFGSKTAKNSNTILLHESAFIGSGLPHPLRESGITLTSFFNIITSREPTA